MKRIIASVLISTTLIQVYGCYSEQLIDKKSLNNNRANKIRIVTIDR